ncbi:hypothetical protein ACP4OV_013405 [Aristida adscensionis]
MGSPQPRNQSWIQPIPSYSRTKHILTRVLTEGKPAKASGDLISRFRRTSWISTKRCRQPTCRDEENSSYAYAAAAFVESSIGPNKLRSWTTAACKTPRPHSRHKEGLWSFVNWPKFIPGLADQQRWLHNLYPHAEARMYPPPPPNPPQDLQGYQRYTDKGEGSHHPYGDYGWPAEASSEYEGNPHHHYSYQEDADCITFLRGWYFCWVMLLLPVGAMLPLIDRVIKKTASGCWSNAASHRYSKKI